MRHQPPKKGMAGLKRPRVTRGGGDASRSVGDFAGPSARNVAVPDRRNRDQDEGQRQQNGGDRAIAEGTTSGLGRLAQPIRDRGSEWPGDDICPPECNDAVEAKTLVAQRWNGHHDGEQHYRSDEAEV